MNSTQTPWLMAATLIVGVLVLLPFRVLRNRPGRFTQTVRAIWLIGAISSGTMLVFTAAKVIDLIPHATAIDVAALAIMGILTGFFLALGLNPPDTHEAGS